MKQNIITFTALGGDNFRGPDNTEYCGDFCSVFPTTKGLAANSTFQIAITDHEVPGAVRIRVHGDAYIRWPADNPQDTWDLNDAERAALMLEEGGLESNDLVKPCSRWAVVCLAQPAPVKTPKTKKTAPAAPAPGDVTYVRMTRRSDYWVSDDARLQPCNQLFRALPASARALGKTLAPGESFVIGVSKVPVQGARRVNIDAYGRLTVVGTRLSYMLNHDYARALALPPITSRGHVPSSRWLYVATAEEVNRDVENTPPPASRVTFTYRDGNFEALGGRISVCGDMFNLFPARPKVLWQNGMQFDVIVNHVPTANCSHVHVTPGHTLSVVGTNYSVGLRIAEMNALEIPVGSAADRWLSLDLSKLPATAPAKKVAAKKVAAKKVAAKKVAAKKVAAKKVAAAETWTVTLVKGRGRYTIEDKSASMCHGIHDLFPELDKYAQRSRIALIVSTARFDGAARYDISRSGRMVRQDTGNGRHPFGLIMTRHLRVGTDNRGYIPGVRWISVVPAPPDPVAQAKRSAAAKKAAATRAANRARR